MLGSMENLTAEFIYLYLSLSDKKHIIFFLFSSIRKSSLRSYLLIIRLGLRRKSGAVGWRYPRFSGSYAASEASLGLCIEKHISCYARYKSANRQNRIRFIFQQLQWASLSKIVHRVTRMPSFNVTQPSTQRSSLHSSEHNQNAKQCRDASHFELNMEPSNILLSRDF